MIRERSVVQSGWQNVWFGAAVLDLCAVTMLKLSIVLRAVTDPDSLGEAVANVRLPLRIATVLYGGLALLAVPILSVDRYPVAVFFAVFLSGWALVYAFLVEPLFNRLAFPPRS
ncbi:MAG TPA: hypothetical protein VFA59_00740 [Vicinamibacterales bacterium]|nr:hypothetical protein [Vicinamibacterales bacterium]